MKMMVVLAVGGMALAAVTIAFASPATSVPNGNIARRVTALETKVKALRVANQGLKSDLSTLMATLSDMKACFGAQGVTQFGAPSQHDGYLYAQSGSVYVTTGLDFPASGQTPQFYVASIKATCVGSSAALFSTLGSRAAHSRRAFTGQ